MMEPHAQPISEVGAESFDGKGFLDRFFDLHVMNRVQHAVAGALSGDPVKRQDGVALASDKLALRLSPGDPGTLQLDAGEDGTVDFSFDRSTFTSIDVHPDFAATIVRDTTDPTRTLRFTWRAAGGSQWK